MSIKYHSELPEKYRKIVDNLWQNFEHTVKYFDLATELAFGYDELGDAASHPKGSKNWEMALLRDELDFAMARCVQKLQIWTSFRARTTRCRDLFINELVGRRGDGWAALELMWKRHDLMAAELDDPVESLENFVDSFVWDTYLRVAEVQELAREFPHLIRPGARQMHGWPMIVSRHLSVEAEFRRIAEQLQLGAEYPLDVSPRKKRGTDTPLLRYLDTLVYRVHVVRKILLASEKTDGGEEFATRIQGFWWDWREDIPSPETLAILQGVPALPPLTRNSAVEWSRVVIVPLIMLSEAKTAETCEEPALATIWRHRAVKSRAGFRSRLHSAVSDTLRRFARPD